MKWLAGKESFISGFIELITFTMNRNSVYTRMKIVTHFTFFFFPLLADDSDVIRLYTCVWDTKLNESLAWG
jgi:hypothetical protein